MSKLIPVDMSVISTVMPYFMIYFKEGTEFSLSEKTVSLGEPPSSTEEVKPRIQQVIRREAKQILEEGKSPNGIAVVNNDGTLRYVWEDRYGLTLEEMAIIIKACLSYGSPFMYDMYIVQQKEDTFEVVSVADNTPQSIGMGDVTDHVEKEIGKRLDALREWFFGEAKKATRVYGVEWEWDFENWKIAQLLPSDSRIGAEGKFMVVESAEMIGLTYRDSLVIWFAYEGVRRDISKITALSVWNRHPLSIVSIPKGGRVSVYQKSEEVGKFQSTSGTNVLDVTLDALGASSLMEAVEAAESSMDGAGGLLT